MFGYFFTSSWIDIKLFAKKLHCIFQWINRLNNLLLPLIHATTILPTNDFEVFIITCRRRNVYFTQSFKLLSDCFIASMDKKSICTNTLFTSCLILHSRWINVATCIQEPIGFIYAICTLSSLFYLRRYFWLGRCYHGVYRVIVSQTRGLISNIIATTRLTDVAFFLLFRSILFIIVLRSFIEIINVFLVVYVIVFLMNVLSFQRARLLIWFVFFRLLLHTVVALRHN